MSRRQLSASDRTDASVSSLSESINNMAIASLQLRHFEELGRGQCGTVYGLLGSPDIAKLANAHAKVGELLTDYRMHHTIQLAMQKHDPSHEISARLPKLGAWHDNKSRFWAEYGLLFDSHVKVRESALMSERVLPAPLSVREALVDALLPMTISRQKEAFLAKPENKNCLIRMYLGRRHTTRKQDRIHNLKLQNFPLHVNEMEELGLDTAHFASVMANTLAIVHWGAMVDGNDVEFVLGSSPAQVRHPENVMTMTSRQLCEATNFEFNHRSMEMWVIDFNQCTLIQDDQAGIDKLVKAFIFNDPYYPRPNQSDDRDKELWAIFRNDYLRTSHMLTEGSGPDTFITRVEMEGKQKRIDSLF
ncbi:zinc finger protein-domain-containing protein [Colletotrichum navitas]|uniref:Zinc finger protein-domain-containing protein n=1 Tax=Colletotrichum navitas TaxID=681940 RepID=A0AAD8VA22_9PEZI|nr:zinc finger protein-domain-containing protein [Colletotrichum navitas]KAK1598624.1 zinc finger protein-domain-containing protein [Colletotrichum navitas]